MELTAAIDIAKSIRDTESTTSELTQGIEDLSSSIFQFKLDTASVDNPLNMTEYIVNPSFESLFNGWTNDGLFTQTNTAFPEKAGSIYVERWVNSGSQVPDVSIKQLLKGIPNGNYILSAGAGNIQQSTANPQTGAFLFAGYRNTAVDIFDVRQVNFTVVDNQVPIGFKTENATGNWVACDNFSLQYVGPYSTDDYALHVSDLINVANGWLSQNVQNSAKAELNNAISTAQAAISANPLVLEDLTNAFEALKTAINNAEVSLQAYANLQDAIDYANEVLVWHMDNQEKKYALEPAIATANATVNNFDLTLVEINNATLDLKTVVQSVDKQTHIPTWMMGDVNNPENNWSYTRSKQSKNWILFWEPGFGNNSNATIDDCLALAETCFEFYANTLKFITIGDSKTDQFKMIIRLRYDSGWEASGSGVDDTIGLLTLTPWALSSRGGQTIAHEVGHCFQYQVHCDNNDFNGWLYGFGAGASGGNGWWEQCAQWQAYKIFPFSQFNNEWFGGYMSNVHKNILHEAPRYENFFIQDYWSDLHGIDIIGRLWNESIKPEDPVEAYKRITGINQNQFNDEMYYCGAKFTTWDIPSLKSYGAGQIANRPQPKMNQVGNDYWMIDPSVCPENYGHNIIKLNAPATATTVTASFEGMVGTNGFRNINGSFGGWRYGFVALKTDGTRVYSEITETNMTVNSGIRTISFECPTNTSKLWFVVSGAPTTHWRHAWDDNDTNDEQWPYKVRFVNTNRLGFANVLSTDSHVFKKDVRIYSENQMLYIKSMPLNANLQIFTLTGSKILNKKLNDTSFSTMLSSGIYIVTIEAGKKRQSFKIITR